MTDATFDRRPLRVLMMADTPPDPNRGAAGTEVQTLHALRALGHDVDAIWSDDLGRRIRHGNLHLLLELPRAYERAAVDALRRKEYDVVHTNQPHGFRAARTVHRLWPRTAFIHRSHGFELNVEETLRPWRERFGSDERGAIRRVASHALTSLLARHAHAIAREADGHIVSSSLDAAFLHEHLGVASERIAVIAQAAPDSYLRTVAPPMDVKRLRRVLHVAQFALFKAPMITAEAMNLLARADPELRFTWVCDRASEGSIRALLTGEASERTDVLHWTTQDVLRDIYDQHGIFLFPSFFEGFGKAFLEAMSRGVCVIASDAGAMRDIIDGRNGLLVPAGDADTLAAAAIGMIRDLEGASAMSAAAARTAREYTWERVGRETAGFYRARLAARAAVGR
jgi:glycosyltransferase involved in cell wall biosynthesis